MRKLVITAVAAVCGVASLSLAQSTGSITQTVNQRNTIGTLSSSPSGIITPDTDVTFTYILNTAGAPAPTSDTVQFYDGASALGSPQAITSISASNLVPYSQVNLTQGWTTSGTLPTVTPLTLNGPDGSTNSASTVSFADSTSTALYAVPSSTSYASQQVTFSVWAYSATPTTLNLTAQDSPHVAASQSAACAVTSAWHRCSLTYTFPAGAGTGFAVVLTASTYSTAIGVWGAQFEVAAAAGPYVSTIGTARPTGAAAGSVSFPFSDFSVGSHTITVQFPGDSNFVASTSNSVVLTVDDVTPTLSVSDSPSGSSVYGVSVTLTAQVSNPASGPTPTGSVSFYDNATLLGTGTLNGSGQATLTLVGASSLAAGSHSITIQYGGDSNFSSATSSAISHSVSQASSSSVVTTTVTSSLNPSVYGDSVVLSIHVSSSVGVQPTGSVTVMDGSTSLGAPSLDGTGHATVTIPAFTAGSHTIVVTYSGDSNYD
jgi:hypothetical protein